MPALAAQKAAAVMAEGAMVVAEAAGISPPCADQFFDKKGFFMANFGL